MATTTPNYGWPVPTSTDLVKDGAVAIEALGDAIDATVFGLGSAGLTLVKAQTIGTAVTSVAVTGAFSTTHDAYKITITGGAGSTEADITMILGSTTTGYYHQISGVNYSGAGTQFGGVANGSSFNYAGYMTTSGLDMNVEIGNPFLAKRTYLTNRRIQSNTGWLGCGYLNDTTSYTAFTLTANSGNLTGGVIRVYGYKNS